jgi:hypothetical protein
MNPNLVQPENRVVVQKARGAFAPHLQIMMGGAAGVEALMQRLEAYDIRVCNRVAAERAEAATRGVHVVYEDTREETFTEIVNSD